MPPPTEATETTDGPAAPDPAPDAALTAPGALSEPLTEVADPPGSPMPWRTIALGTAGTVMIMLAAVGAGGILEHDPVIGTGPLSAVRFGHGQMLATAALYLGFVLVVWAWVRLGRHVLAGRIGTRPVLIAAVCWAVPMLFSPPVFTRDVFSYLAYGAMAAHGLDPYQAGGPLALVAQPDVVFNVHPFWQSTPSPYGPLFLLIAKGVAALTGNHMVAGVLLMRLVMVPGLVLAVWSVRELVRDLGGRTSVAMWLVAASPMTVVHLLGGPHNDMLMLGFLASGTLLVLRRKHWAGIALVTLAMGIKATAAVALPFLVLVWAGHLLGATWWRRFGRALLCSLLTFAVTFAACTLLAGVGFGWLTALQGPASIQNWMSLPTGLGELLHKIVSLVVDLPIGAFTVPTRALGALLLIVVGVKQWRRSRDGGPDAVKRMALVLFLVAALSPVTLPWYLTWGFFIAAAAAWRRRQLSVVVGVAVFLVLTYTPGGEDLLYNLWFMCAAAAVSVLAAAALLEPDPLRLFGGRDTEPVEPVQPVG